jgi:membrane fusion protein, heavy metal efflux system
MKRSHLNFIAGMLLVAAGISMQGCGEKETKPAEKVKYTIPDSLMHTLVIDTVRKCPLVNALTLTGMVDFDQDKQVNIFALVSGNVEDVKVQLGDHVSAGQTLAIIKSTEMANYSNNLVVAQTNVDATKKQLDAQKELYKNGLSSVLDVTAAQTNYDQARSALETAKRVIKINGSSENGEYVVRAPISGFIVQKNITNNTFVRSDNTNALFTISDLNQVWVQANVYEANIEKVHVGDQAQVKVLSEPDKIFTGKVDKILNVLDPTSKVAKVRVVLDNADYVLKPQMFASVMVANPENREALCISSKALVYENSRYYVVLYKGGGNADIAPVEVLNTLGDKTYINSGIAEGDKIIAAQALQIYTELNN